MSDEPRKGNAVKMAAEEGTGAVDPKAVPRHKRTRKPFGSMDQKLAWDPVPGMHIYWFNDVPGRVERAKDAGYEHVTDADGKPVKRNVGVGVDGNGLSAYLMQIPQEWYEEDMRIEQRKVDELEEGITRGEIDGRGLSKEDKGEHFYVGKQGIKVRHGLQIRR